MVNGLEIRYVPRGEITEKQQKMIETINIACFGAPENYAEEYARKLENNEEVEPHPHGAVELGKFLLFDGEQVVGQVFVHKRLVDYDGEEYYIGGFGGLAVMPEYTGKGYARQLAEKALAMSYDIGVDVACLYTGREETVYKFYEKLGYRFINRKGYYLNSIYEEEHDDNIMILGLNNKAMAEKILTTDHKFHYGKEEGYW
jgi:GNAT superfamily N-acetyltransferase